jgi:hypothetical protein
MERVVFCLAKGARPDEQFLDRRLLTDGIREAGLNCATHLAAQQCGQKQ